MESSTVTTRQRGVSHVDDILDKWTERMSVRMSEAPPLPENDLLNILPPEPPTVLPPKPPSSQRVEGGSTRRHEEENLVSIAIAGVPQQRSMKYLPTGAVELPKNMFEDVQYHVKKINSFRVNGHTRMDPRVLRFTHTGVENIKESAPNTMVVTKFHPYADIAACYLRKFNRLVVVYFDDHEFCYEVDEAMGIAEELNRRITMTKALERTRNGVLFSPDALREACGLFISQKGKVLTRLALETGQIRTDILEAGFVESDDDEDEDDDNDDEDDNDETKGVGEQRKVGYGDMNEQPRTGKRITSKLRREQLGRIRVGTYIDRLLVDKNSPEGRTSATFIANSQALFRSWKSAADNAVRRIAERRRTISTAMISASASFTSSFSASSSSIIGKQQDEEGSKDGIYSVANRSVPNRAASARALTGKYEPSAGGAESQTKMKKKKKRKELHAGVQAISTFCEQLEGYIIANRIDELKAVHRGEEIDKISERLSASSMHDGDDSGADSSTQKQDAQNGANRAPQSVGSSSTTAITDGNSVGANIGIQDKRRSSGSYRQSSPSQADVEAEVDLVATISSIIRSSIETLVVLPLRELAMRHLDTRSADETLLRRYLWSIQNNKQEFFGIPFHNRSRTNWRSAIYELRNALGREQIPSRQLEGVTAAARAIFYEHEHDWNIKGNEGEERSEFYQPLAADDLLPIFFFVVAKACLPSDNEKALPRRKRGSSFPFCKESGKETDNAQTGSFDIHSDDNSVKFGGEVIDPLRIRDLLWAIGDQTALRSEAGYYLTTLDAALEWLLSEAQDALAEAQMQDRFSQEARSSMNAGSPNYKALSGRDIVIDGNDFEM